MYDFLIVCFYPDCELVAAGSLLKKYLTLLCAHVADVLPIAASLAAYSSSHFCLVAKLITRDVSGKHNQSKLTFHNLIISLSEDVSFKYKI